jgi:hypothetical protein
MIATSYSEVSVTSLSLSLYPEKSPQPLFGKEGFENRGENSPFEKGGQRGI